MLRTRPGPPEDALRTALEVTLLGRTEMELLFPESEIVAERVAGLARSPTAVERNRGLGQARSPTCSAYHGSARWSAISRRVHPSRGASHAAGPAAA